MANAVDVDATDSAVELADSEGVDLSEVEGTGTGGKVTKADVEAHLEAQDGEESDDEEEGDEEEAPLPAPGGDVDIADIPQELLEGETPAPVQPDSWVTLGDSEDVPEEVQGHYASIVSIDESDPEEPVYTVRTRDEYNATLTLTEDDFAAVHPGGTSLRGVGP